MRGEILSLLLLLAPLPAGAQALSELCGAANAASCPGYGTIGGGKPPSGGYEEKAPVCDPECQRRAAERHAAAYKNMLQIRPVPEIDDVAIREGRTVKAALQADDQEHLAIVAFGTLYVGRTLISPWWALGSFAVVIVLPSLHLEQHVPVVMSMWDSWTFAAKKVDKGAKPKNCPTGTLPIDKDERIPREHHGKLKKQVGAGNADWTGITPDGRIITNDEKGEARDNGPYESFLP